MFQCTNIIGIVMHRLEVPGILVGNLLPETFSLVFRIVQLGKAIGDFPPADKEFKTVGDKRIIIIAPCQR